MTKDLGVWTARDWPLVLTNAFEDETFRRAAQAAGRRRLIIGGLHTEICPTFAAVQALKDGYDALYVADAVGGRSQTAHRIAIERAASAPGGH